MRWMLALAVALAGCAAEAPESYAKWTSSDAIEAFKAAGLEAENVSAISKNEMEMAPTSFKEGTHFFVPSLCEDCGGRAFSFENAEDQKLVADYYNELGRRSGMLFSWVFEYDNLVVQINGDLPEAQARQYEAALKTLQ